VRQARGSNPILPLRVFASTKLSAANVIQALMSSAFLGFFFMASLDLERVLGYGPMALGLAFLPVTVVMGLFSLRFSALLINRVGPLAVLVAGQAVIVVQVALGGILVAMGSKPPGLHVLYGVLPLLVSLIAESLRASTAQLVLDQRGFASAQAVGQLPEDEQREVVAAIVKRELAVMAIAAVVVVVLLARAAQTHG